MTDKNPQISLIVCTLGRRASFARALSSFARQSCTSFEVIVVDQNPAGYLEEELARFAKQFRIVHVRAEPGLSRARNIGLVYARGDIVGFPDDDCWYGADVCQRVLDAFAARPTLALLTGRTVDAMGHSSLSGDYRMTPGPISRLEVFRTGNSNTFFLRHAVLSKIGGFDESLGVGEVSEGQSGEETDLMIGCIDGGFETHYDPNFLVFHDQVCEDRSEMSVRRTVNYSTGFGHLLRRHNFGPLYMAYRVARSVAGAALYLARADASNARLRLSWARGTVRGFLMRAAPRSAA